MKEKYAIVKFINVNYYPAWKKNLTAFIHNGKHAYFNKELLLQFFYNMFMIWLKSSFWVRHLCKGVIFMSYQTEIGQFDKGYSSKILQIIHFRPIIIQTSNQMIYGTCIFLFSQKLERPGRGWKYISSSIWTKVRDNKYTICWVFISQA